MKAKTCQYCCHAFKPIGAGCAILICTNKEGCEGALCVVKPEGLCRRFKAKAVSIQQKSEKPRINAGKLIPLTQGKFAIVDAEDYHWLSRYKWRADEHYRAWYAMRSRDRTTVSMHRQIMNPPEGLVIDHIDHNGLNNRRSNLRICTRSQNQCNQRRFGGKSKYKGVTWLGHTKKWVARVCSGGNRYHLGCFEREIDAAMAYDRKAVELFGQFAYLNFPEVK